MVTAQCVPFYYSAEDIYSVMEHLHAAHDIIQSVLALQQGIRPGIP